MSLIKGALVASIFAVLCCLIWLLVSIQRGKNTLTWSPKQAFIADQERTESYHTVNGVTRKSIDWQTTIGYNVDNKTYEKTFSRRLRNPIIVYVHPQSPSRMVLTRGVTPERVGIPSFCLIFTGVFFLAMIAISLSPTETD